MFRNRSSEYEPIGHTNTAQDLRNDNKDEILCTIFGYINHSTCTFLFHFFGIVFLGLPYVLIKLFPKLKTVKYKRCPLEIATILLVHDNHGQSSFIKVKFETIKLPSLGSEPVNLRYFIYQHTKYVWVPTKEMFASLNILIPYLTLDDYLNDANGLNDFDYLNTLQLYGPNKIEVEVMPYWQLFFEEVFNPFYIFQAFSVVLWFYDEYVSYAVCVIILTLFSSITSLIQTRKQSEALHDLVESSKCHEVNVLRRTLHSENILETTDPVELVPGDLIVLPAANFVMPCDAVLLTGQCIVNESVLTGESVPITKTALPSSNESYVPNVHKRHTLFSGTHIIQTRYIHKQHVLARVVRTGFDTTKGSLVKSILFPSPVGLGLFSDSIKFVCVLFTVAAAGMSYCLYMYISRGAKIKQIVIRTLDIITVVVPPALPAAMAVGTVYSQNRLKKLGIYCISPPRINVCGKIKLACFDKTGTLTLDGLDMNSVVPCNNAQFSVPLTDVCELDIRSKFVQAMATCHSLTRIDGELNGDPLDLNMFEFTKWNLEEPGDNENARYDMLAPTVVAPGKKCAKQLLKSENSDLPYQIGIIRQFPFSSTLQCMSVICRNLETPHMVAFTKGAPEKIQGMCLRHTIPNDFNGRLAEYSAQGYRVIAMGCKDLPKKFKWKEAQKSKRDVIECDLTFLGFLIMQNPLKAETAPVIRVLHNANIRTVMITGDNIMTAISVARDCGMVGIHDEIVLLGMENCEDPDVIPKLIFEKAGSTNNNENIAISFNSNHLHFAVDGKTWDKLKCYYPDLIPPLLVRTTIFARFQPDQKTQLVINLQNLDYVVSMVGDGANDCGALKAAHVGVSLSAVAEASVAAPFTSSIQDISCIIHLMLEGRCALVTSFAIFKYMAVYSLIQFFTVLILYRQHSNLGDYQFLFIDLVITASLAITIGRQGPSGNLGVKGPISSLVAARNVIPLVLQIGVCASVQLAALYYLYKQTAWFEPIPTDTHQEQILSWENTVLFTVSCYQYIILATVYSKGRPYREMLITNFWFLIGALSLTTFITWLIVQPSKMFAELMDIIYLPHRAHDQIVFRYTLVGFPVVHFVVAFFIEVGIADRKWFKAMIRSLRCKKVPRKKHKFLLQENDLQFWRTIDNNRIHPVG